MNPKEMAWRQRVGSRIIGVARASGRVSLRELQRRTNYNRQAAGIDEPISVWYEVLESLTKQGHIRFENLDGTAVEVREAGYRDRLWAVWLR